MSRVFRAKIKQLIRAERVVDEKGKRGKGSERGMEDYHGPCCPPESVWHQYEPSCQWVLIMEDWHHCVAAGS